mgnify:CR=1 FL=1
MVGIPIAEVADRNAFAAALRERRFPIGDLADPLQHGAHVPDASNGDVAAFQVSGHRTLVQQVHVKVDRITSSGDRQFVLKSLVHPDMLCERHAAHPAERLRRLDASILDPKVRHIVR